jgi:hypothetical protein
VIPHLWTASVQVRGPDGRWDCLPPFHFLATDPTEASRVACRLLYGGRGAPLSVSARATLRADTGSTWEVTLTPGQHAFQPEWVGT